MIILTRYPALRIVLSCTLLWHFVAILAVADSEPSHPAAPPNLVLILSDDHSYPNLGCYTDANATTPHFDRFAAEGMRFDRAYTMAPQCVPSRASILTGRSPIDVDMTRFSAPLDRQFQTFPEILREHGYFTGVMGRYFHLDGPRFPRGTTKRVFDEHDLATGADRFDFLQVNRPPPRPAVRDVLVEFFEECQDRPFFLWANFHEPHRLWRPASRPDPAGLMLPPDFPELPSIRDDLANLYGVLEELDQKFGELVTALDERGLRENTLILFMGDNGCALLRGKGTLYERGCHVPMLVRWPARVAAGSHSDDLVSGNDIAPTFLAAAGFEAPDEMSGRSFLPLLVGDREYTPRKAVFAERGVHAYGLPRDTITFDLARSITTKTHRLIYNALWDRRYAPVDIEDYKRPFWDDLRERHQAGTLPELFDTMFFQKTRPMFELYDLQDDPYELNNLAGTSDVAKLERQLKDQLAEWMIRERDFLPLPTEH